MNYFANAFFFFSFKYESLDHAFNYLAPVFFSFGSFLSVWLPFIFSVSCPRSLIGYTPCKIGDGTSIHLIGYTQDQSWKGCVFPGCVPC